MSATCDESRVLPSCSCCCAEPPRHSKQSAAAVNQPKTLTSPCLPHGGMSAVSALPGLPHASAQCTASPRSAPSGQQEGGPAAASTLCQLAERCQRPACKHEREVAWLGVNVSPCAALVSQHCTGKEVTRTTHYHRGYGLCCLLLCMLHCMLFSTNNTWRYTAQTGEHPLAVTVAGTQASAVTGPPTITVRNHQGGTNQGACSTTATLCTTSMLIHLFADPSLLNHLKNIGGRLPLKHLYARIALCRQSQPMT